MSLIISDTVLLPVQKYINMPPGVAANLMLHNNMMRRIATQRDAAKHNVSHSQASSYSSTDWEHGDGDESPVYSKCSTGDSSGGVFVVAVCLFLWAAYYF